MPTAYKVLGQSAPSATTATTLYTCPSSTQTVISTITVCNRGSSDSTFRIAVRPNNASLSSEHYVAYDTSIGGNEVIGLTLGITIDASDVITVYSSSADLTFNAYGSEIS